MEERNDMKALNLHVMTDNMQKWNERKEDRS